MIALALLFCRGVLVSSPLKPNQSLPPSFFVPPEDISFKERDMPVKIKGAKLAKKSAAKDPKSAKRATAQKQTTVVAEQSPLSVFALTYRRDGVVVVPCSAGLSFSRTDFAASQKEFAPSAERFSLGGFGAMGNPSSFHCPVVRAVRLKAYTETLFPIFQEIWGASVQSYSEVLWDRFSIRYKGTTMTKETWHRDISVKSPGDVILGGWLNLDPAGSPPQRFSCVKGNIMQPKDVGFVRFTKEQAAALEKQKSIVEIPPGHAIFFDQSIAHEVLPVTQTQDSWRVYLSHRITTSSGKTQPAALYDKAAIMAEQSVPQI